ncbi:MAG: CopG family transcriptional regulator [Verrucomicrobia bacterium]|nr:CopG family transcriptional regulator [Verrucomicrobiota bacterium]MCH8527247.1 CopG family transcriptional regulator [Kiritimatiellia bacterium]
MSKATLYLDETVHKALRLKSAESRQTMSDLVNEAIRVSLFEDYEDLEDIRVRRNEKTIGYEEFLKNLKTDGILV